MAVNWRWDHKLGEIVYKQETKEGKSQTWRLELFGGNMMCCFIYRFKKTNEQTGKKEKFYNFFTWLNDIKHAKRCFKDTRLEDLALGRHKVFKVRLKVTDKNYLYSNQEMLKLAKIFAEMGYKVELY